MHAIEKRIELVKAIGGKNIVKEMELGDLKELKVREEIKNQISRFSKRIKIGFQLGASHLARAWPIANFVKLAKILTKELDCIFVLIGNKKEKFLAEKFKKEYKIGNILDIVGKTNIEELPYVVKKLDILITPDTGTLHLAIALKVKTISLFALSLPEETGPIQDLHLHKVIFKPEGLKWLAKDRKKSSQEAMKLISVEEVEKAVRELLEK